MTLADSPPSKRRLLVTGARGFVGSILTRAIFGGDDADRYELVDFTDPLTGKSVDLRDAVAVDQVIAAGRPDIVIHLAGIAAPREARSQPEQAWAVNVMGTFHLAQAVLTHVPKARFVWAGSSEAYGAAFNRSPSPVAETAALEPMSPYGATKAAADILLRQLAHEGLDVVAFRPFNHTGAGQSPAYVVPAFAQQIARIEAGLQEPVLRVGNLEAWRDFLDVRDVVSAYWNAASRDSVRAGEAYNLSRGAPIQIGAILEMLTGLARVPVKIEIDPARYVANDIAIASGNPDKVFNDLGWSATIPFEETLAGVLDHCRTLI